MSWIVRTLVLWPHELIAYSKLGIRNVADRLRSADVLVFNGDVLSGVDLQKLVATHRDGSADVTLHLTRVEDPRAFGSVPTDDGGRVQAFLEKSPEPVTDQVNAGCYVFRREVLAGIPTMLLEWVQAQDHFFAGGLVQLEDLAAGL